MDAANVPSRESGPKSAAVPEQTIGQALAEAARRYGKREGFTFADRRLSFVDVDKESDALARALLSSGVKRGERIAGLDGQSLQLRRPVLRNSQNWERCSFP